MRRFIITDEQRQEVLNYLKNRSYSSGRNMLNQLEEIKDQALKSDADRNAAKEEGPSKD
ncbi:MAG: hypothetical protein WD512_05845 [Candidatus Paceibacterota bacterium]